MLNAQLKWIKALLVLALALNIALWYAMHKVQARWANVPPAPESGLAASYGLGDSEFSYRLLAIMIQNLGDTGGRSTSLKDYDYNKLTKWFFLQDKLNPHSNHIPYLAAFYFGSVQEPEKYRPVLNYLESVGIRPEGEKWRFLAQAVYLARFKMNDINRALELAQKLALNPNPNMPNWTRQMPAFIMNAQGEKEAAYALLVEILKSSANKLDPAEVNHLRHYICENTLTPEKAKEDPLCQNLGP